MKRMDWLWKVSRAASGIRAGRRCATAVFLTIAIVATMARNAPAAQWLSPDIDMESYIHISQPGVRAIGASFAGPLDVVAGQFVANTDPQFPARAGTSLFAYKTSTQITASLLPSQ